MIMISLSQVHHVVPLRAALCCDDQRCIADCLSQGTFLRYARESEFHPLLNPKEAGALESSLFNVCSPLFAARRPEPV